MQPLLVLKTFPHPLELRTPRLTLRPWRDDDIEPWLAMNADAEVRRYLGGPASADDARGEAQRIRDNIARRGWGVWAVELPRELPFAGFVGLHVTHFKAPFVPCVELGWRLARAAWGRGIASEGAAAAARFGFEVLGLDELVAYTMPDNQPSRRVMERLGMRHDPADDFDHPLAKADDPWRRHVLYRLDRASFARRGAAG